MRSNSAADVNRSPAGDEMREGAVEPSATSLDIMSAPAAAGAPLVDPTDLLRAREYVLLAALLARAPSRDLLSRLAALSGDDTPFGRAHRALAEAARQAEPDDVGHEFFDLFIGVGRGELLPYASYYLTGFLNERPLARLREDLKRIGIARAEGVAEPEDHAAILCEIMAGLANGHLPGAEESSHTIFENH